MRWSILNCSKTAAKFRSVFKEFPFFNYVQSKAMDEVSTSSGQISLTVSTNLQQALIDIILTLEGFIFLKGVMLVV